MAPCVHEGAAPCCGHTGLNMGGKPAFREGRLDSLVKHLSWPVFPRSRRAQRRRQAAGAADGMPGPPNPMTRIRNRPLVAQWPGPAWLGTAGGTGPACTTGPLPE